ncbi:MAG: HEPN domain-containing protein [Thermoflexia bacterium]|nr:MAG: HEPN domain-containing protein [Thermoflexia bacterium]
MKTVADLVCGWLRKAESDLVSAELCLEAGRALDMVCFHAQQAAEKYLKAYRTAWGIDFPLVHNLEKLIELCARRDPEFLSLKPLGQQLTPYAVSLRYDPEFWPEIDVAEHALHAALTIKEFVPERLPAEMKEEEGM